MSASARAISMANDIRDELAKRFATVGAVTITSTGAWVLVGAGTTGTQSAVVNVTDFAPLGTNSIGQSATGYGNPLVIQVAGEISATSPQAFLTPANQMALFGMLAHRGTRIELYMRTTGTGPAIGDITGTPTATFDADLKWKLTSSL